MTAMNTWYLRSDSEEASIRRAGSSEQSTYKKCWLVYAGQDATAAHASFSQKLDGEFGAIPGKFGDYWFNYDGYTAKHLGNGYWEVEATYVTSGGGQQAENRDNQNIGVSIGVSFDTTGGTTHITEALDEDRYGNGPAMQKAIRVNGDSVEGCDIVVPTFEWSEDYEIPGGNLKQDYVTAVADLTGKTNNAAFRGFGTGDVLFLGCTGSQKYNPNQALYSEASVVQLSYRFAYKPRRNGFTVGNVFVFTKGGWEYMWVQYEDDVRDNTHLKKATGVYINKVYEEGDFKTLKLPGN